MTRIIADLESPGLARGSWTGLVLLGVGSRVQPDPAPLHLGELGFSWIMDAGVVPAASMSSGSCQLALGLRSPMSEPRKVKGNGDEGRGKVTPDPPGIRDQKARPD